MIPSFISIPIMLTAAFIIPVIGAYKKDSPEAIALLASVSSFILSLATIPPLLENKILTEGMAGWSAPFGIAITIDLFSLLVITTVTFTGMLVVMYSIGHAKTSKIEYYTLVCLLLAGLLGISHTGDLFNMFVFLEIASISSYALTAFKTDSKSIEASIKYLVMGSFATSLVLLGIALTYGLTGTLNMADIAVALKTANPQTVRLILALLFSGLAFKSAIVPLHTWKPDVIESAPVAIGTLFAASSTTVYIYAIIRLTSTVFPIDISMLMLAAGTLTMLLGALMAIQQKNILRLLAYSAISQIGYIMIAFGTSPEAGIYHLFNVAIIDALLIMSAGAVVRMTKKQDLDELSATKKTMNRIIPIAFLIGALSNAGVPLLNGFSSKWLIYTETLITHPLVTLLAIFTSAITLSYSLKAYTMMFRNTEYTKTTPKLGTFVPLIALIAVCIAFGIMANLGGDISYTIAESLKSNTQYIQAVLGK